MPTSTRYVVKLNDGEEIVFEDWRRIQELQLRELSDGILHRLFDGVTGFFGGDFAVSAASGFNVHVAVGRGYRDDSAETDPDGLGIATYKLLELESTYVIPLDPADVTYPRIDRVVAKEATEDRDSEMRRVKDADPPNNIENVEVYKSTASISQIQYLPGNPDPSPAPPDVPTGWVALAQIAVAANASSITSGDITDERVILQISASLVPITEGISDHGALSGLADNDHDQYLERAGGQDPGITGNITASDTVLIGTLSANHHQSVGGTDNHPLATADPGGVAGFMSPAEKAKLAQQGATGITAFGFEYTSVTSVKIVPNFSGKVFIDLDDGSGNFATRASNPSIDSGKITFTMPTNLDTGGEAASIWYYLYVHWSGTVITPHISATGPNLTTAQHPSHSTWRYVGAIYNDTSSNFRPQDRFGQLVFFRNAQPDDILDSNIGGSFVDLDCRKAGPRSTLVIALAKASSTGSLDNWIYIRAKGDSGPGRKRSPRQGGVDFDTVDANGYAQIMADGSPSCVIGTAGYVETLLR